MYYAKQISPEYTESPFDFILPEYFDEEYIIFGNKDFQSFTSIKWDIMQDYIPEIENNIDIEAKDNKIIETVKEYFTQIDNEIALKIGKRVIEKIITDDKKGYYANEQSYYCDIYSLLIGTKYNYCQISGSMQREWNYIYFPANYTREQINIIEMEYFNTGTEYIIHDEEEEPKEPENITGYSVYCHGYTDEQNKEELCSVIGCKPEELKIFNIENEYKITKYIYKEV